MFQHKGESLLIMGATRVPCPYDAKTLYSCALLLGNLRQNLTVFSEVVHKIATEIFSESCSICDILPSNS